MPPPLRTKNAFGGQSKRGGQGAEILVGLEREYPWIEFQPGRSRYRVATGPAILVRVADRQGELLSGAHIVFNREMPPLAFFIRDIG